MVVQHIVGADGGERGSLGGIDTPLQLDHVLLVKQVRLVWQLSTGEKVKGIAITMASCHLVAIAQVVQ